MFGLEMSVRKQIISRKLIILAKFTARISFAALTHHLGLSSGLEHYTEPFQIMANNNQGESQMGL